MTDVRRETLRQHVARLDPEGAPSGLVPVRLVPVEVFGGDCDCHLMHDHDDNSCSGWGYGLCDAVDGMSDCNRAVGGIYRRDEGESPRSDGNTILVWVTPEQVALFDVVFGEP